MNLETKIKIVECNSRASGQSAARHARQQLQRAQAAFAAQVEAIEQSFDIECWNGFKRECSPAEIERFEAALNYPI